MSLRAPVHVPVELRHADRGRWFRLASAVGVEGLWLADVVPEELAMELGSLAVAFHLPGDRDPIRCHGRISTEVGASGKSERDDERSERRAVTFIDLDEAGRERIHNYVNERLDPSA